MSDKTMYFWMHGHIETAEMEIHSAESVHDENPDWMHRFCVDTQYPSDSTGRYGMYFDADAEGWCAMPFEKFPPEFKAALLLLGVS